MANYKRISNHKTSNLHNIELSVFIEHQVHRGVMMTLSLKHKNQVQNDFTMPYKAWKIGDDKSLKEKQCKTWKEMFKRWENKELERLFVIKGSQPNNEKKGRKLNSKKT